MIIKDKGSRLLTDIEVLELVKQQTDNKNSSTSASVIQQQVAQALQDAGTKHVNRLALKQFLVECKARGLTKAEALQVANTRPTSNVVVHLIVEDCENRYSDDQVEQLLLLVKEALG